MFRIELIQKEYFLDEMEYIKETAIIVCRLCRTIGEEFDRCEIIGNLYTEVLNISEPLSIIEIMIHEYQNSYSMIGQTKTEESYPGYNPEDLLFGYMISLQMSRSAHLF